jgi:hypothetical protein
MRRSTARHGRSVDARRCSEVEERVRGRRQSREEKEEIKRGM